MAKENYVLLNGQVTQNPRIMKDEDGNYLRGMCSITVIRGVRDFGDNISHLKYDCPVIMTGNPEKIAEMETWHANDMVEVKGVITTKGIKKVTMCRNPECGAKNKVDGNYTYINPIYLERRETGLTKEEGLELLKKRCEISNYILCVGTLCRDVDVYDTGNMKIAQYQIAVNRKYRLRDSSAEERTDYPWVKSYGENAESDSKSIKTGSVVLIDGMVQTREIVRTSVCSECGTSYKWNDQAMEIVPYQIEYLQNFITSEEWEAKQLQAEEDAKRQIFGE